GRDFLLCTRLASRPHGLKGTSSVREEVQIASIMAGHDSGTHHQFTGIAKYFNSYTITGRRNCSRAIRILPALLRAVLLDLVMEAVLLYWDHWEVYAPAARSRLRLVKWTWMTAVDLVRYVPSNTS
ncbi:hypothetical protein QTP70_022729, partial [Hemibagrus guttatus]